MKARSICALAAALAMFQFAIPAYAQTAEPAQFRTAAPETFTAEELQGYGLSAEETARAVALQEEGYRIVALTPEEAAAYEAGAISQTEWILIGIGVLIILAIA
ncbi:MAG TPA: hypothetical protein VEF55_05655 [Candidatus Binatia bacterium]|nr:hypothetical protein [Candidatus Binatia bacterium]